MLFTLPGTFRGRELSSQRSRHRPEKRWDFAEKQGLPGLVWESGAGSAGAAASGLSLGISKELEDSPRFCGQETTMTFNAEACAARERFWRAGQCALES